MPTGPAASATLPRATARTTAAGQPRSHTLAVVGVVFSVLVWPVGLLIALIDLIRYRRRYGTVHKLGVAGLAVAVVVAAVSVTVGVSLLSAPRHHDDAKACELAESGAAGLSSVIPDEQQFQSAQGGGQSAYRKAAGAFADDLQGPDATLKRAEGEASPGTAVQQIIHAVLTDLDGALGGFRAAQQGDSAAGSSAFLSATRLPADVQIMESTCQTAAIAAAASARADAATGSAVNALRQEGSRPGPVPTSARFLPAEAPDGRLH